MALSKQENPLGLRFRSRLRLVSAMYRWSLYWRMLFWSCRIIICRQLVCVEPLKRFLPLYQQGLRVLKSKWWPTWTNAACINPAFFASARTKNLFFTEVNLALEVDRKIRSNASNLPCSVGYLHVWVQKNVAVLGNRELIPLHSDRQSLTVCRLHQLSPHSSKIVVRKIATGFPVKFVFFYTVINRFHSFHWTKQYRSNSCLTLPVTLWRALELVSSEWSFHQLTNLILISVYLYF